MPFLSECTFCQHQVRVPDHAVGLSVPCPRCGNSFTLAAVVAPRPEPPLGIKARGRKKKDAPLAAMNGPPTPAVLSPRAAVPKTETPAPEEYVKAALQADQILPVAPLPPGKVFGRRAAPPPGWANLAGALSVLVGSLALLSFEITGVSLLALPTAAAGLLLGILGVLIYWDAPRRQLLFPTLGSVVNLAGIGVMWFCPSLLTLGPADGGEEADRPPDQILVGNLRGGKTRPADPSDWVDAGKASLAVGGVRVRVTEVAVKRVRLTDDKAQNLGRGKKLVIGLRLVNAGNPRRLVYRGWGERGQEGHTYQPRLLDDRDNSYSLVPVPAGAAVEGQRVRAVLVPGKPITDVLVFEPPAAGVKFLLLELPAGAFGAGGNLRLRIPAALIDRP
jgi:hypothetical protein